MALLDQIKWIIEKEIKTLFEQDLKEEEPVEDLSLGDTIDQVTATPEEEATEEPEPEQQQEEPEPEEPEDPVEKLLTDAAGLAEQQYSVHEILGLVKSFVQENFTNYNEAMFLVQRLQNENDPILKDVSDRLLHFIKGF